LAGLAGLGRGRSPRSWLAGHQAEVPHEVADQLGPAVLALTPQRGVDAAMAVGAVGGVEDRLDKSGQPSATARGRRGRSVPPGVEARGRNLQPCAHLHDRVVGLVRVDERVLLAHRYSWAKKAAAFPTTSVFIRDSRFYRSSSRSRARSGRVNGGSSPACSTRYLLTQLPSVPSCTPISRATSAIGREVSTTRRTASDLNFGVNFALLPHRCSSISNGTLLGPLSEMWEARQALPMRSLPSGVCAMRSGGARRPIVGEFEAVCA